MPASSSSEPRSRACGWSVFSVRRTSAATGSRLRRPVWRSMTGADKPVARGEPLVLGREDPVERRDLLAAVDELRVVLDERLAVRGDRDHVVEPRHGVADPDLDRAEPRMEADVPPDVRVVLDAAGLLELVHDLRVVGVVAEARRRARAREGGEDHVARRAEAGRLAAPERRARRERDELVEMGDQPVHDLDRLLGVVDGDVDVHPEDQLAPRDVLHLVDERAVAVLRGDPLRARRARTDACRPSRRAGPSRARRRARSARMRSSCCCTPAGVWQTGVATSSTDCISSELMRGSSSWPATAASTVSMCWTRSNVSPSRSMYSSSTPSVYGSLVPEGVVEHAPAGRELRALARDRRRDQRIGHAKTISRRFAGRKRASLGKERVGLDLDLPARVEQPRDDEHRRRGTVRLRTPRRGRARRLPSRPRRRCRRGCGRRAPGRRRARGARRR